MGLGKRRVFRFAKPEDAEAFAERFGGELFWLSDRAAPEPACALFRA
jgi:hypothetical protein